MEIPISEVVSFGDPMSKNRSAPVWRACSLGVMIDDQNGRDYWIVQQTDNGYGPVKWCMVLNLKFPLAETHPELPTLIEAKRYVEARLKRVVL